MHISFYFMLFTLCCLLIKFGSRYCACLFQKRAPDHEIRHYTPLNLAVDAIMRFRPRQLSDPPRSFAGNPLEDQYQKEFYRCLFNMLDGHVLTSPEFVVKTGTNGGTIDFFVAQMKWGLEVLRGRDHLVKHMERFETGGQYFNMIENGEMEKYIVLDFTVVPPTIPLPGNTFLLLVLALTDVFFRVPGTSLPRCVFPRLPRSCGS